MQNNNDWTGYKTMHRSKKAAIVNKFIKDVEKTAKEICNGDIHAEYGVRQAAVATQFISMNLSAAEVAEAILLTEVTLPWCDYDGKGRFDASADWMTEANDLVDRAMDMASQWSDPGYPDCFTMHDIGFTEFGSLETLRQLVQRLKLSESAGHAIEAGAVAAKAASDVQNFMIMTRPDRHQKPLAV